MRLAQQHPGAAQEPVHDVGKIDVSCSHASAVPIVADALEVVTYATPRRADILTQNTWIMTV